jgi:very-short-patch-repair endonuclease
MHRISHEARINHNLYGLRLMSVPGCTLCSMERELPYTLRNLARYQYGVVSRSQALRSGLTEDMIKFRVKSDRWRQLHPGVYATFTGTPGRGAQMWAAVLSLGQGAVLSHETAAELYGLIDKAVSPIHVTVPRQRHLVAVSGVSVHRSARAVEAVLGHSNPPRTKIEETVLDLTQTAATFDDVCGWVTRAFARDLTDEARLRTAMGMRSKLRWRADLDELIAAAANGDHSVLEYRYDRDVERAHGLPEARRQVPFTGPGGRGRRDRVYEDYEVVVELDGRLAHPDDSAWKDKARDNAAAVEGKQTLRYNWEQVRRKPCETAAEVATVLRQRGWPGRARACSPGCPAPRAFPWRASVSTERGQQVWRVG